MSRTQLVVQHTRKLSGITSRVLRLSNMFEATGAQTDRRGHGGGAGRRSPTHCTRLPHPLVQHSHLHPSWGSQLIDCPRSLGRPAHHSQLSCVSRSSSPSFSSSTSQLVALVTCRNSDGSLGRRSLQNLLPTIKSLLTTQRCQVTTMIQAVSRRALIGGMLRPLNQRLRVRVYHWTFGTLSCPTIPVVRASLDNTQNFADCMQ